MTVSCPVSATFNLHWYRRGHTMRVARKMARTHLHGAHTIRRDIMSACMLRTLAVWLLAVPFAAAAEPMDDLLRRVPSDANAVLAIDVGRMYTSPIAVTHNWKKTHEKDYVSVAAGIPPSTKRIVVAAML